MDKKYLDANIFIQGILREDNNSKETLLRIAKGEFIGVTSLLSWDEITFIVRKFIGKEIAEIEGRKLFKLPNLKFVEVNRNIINKAQKIFEKYNIKPRDSIHAATAILQGCKEIISEDSDFDKVSELKRVAI
ncbi:VapC toxin family PIN domain ribonuclease [Candidatus Pacearchaeota archaeon]|nr:VapC toxin family PIN domain ribonuclease [Candidatus Pacearchaeota archaeon]|tara:strand:- start:1148 stop:1543 length:396 start_codon:yes stop_codon:yes gene_type:complete